MLLPVRFLLIPDLCCFLYQVSKLRYYFQCIDFKIKVSERKYELDYEQLLFFYLKVVMFSACVAAIMDQQTYFNPLLTDYGSSRPFHPAAVLIRRVTFITLRTQLKRLRIV